MKRGWCPGIYDPMPAEDGLLVRVKPPGARLSSDAARRLAGAATRYGNGTIQATSRGNFQVRGLTAIGAADFAAEMVAAGLAHADPGVEVRRCVMASPLAGDDPTAAADAESLAAGLEAMLAEPGFPALSPKFGIAVDGGGVLPGSAKADITIRTDGVRHWIVLDDAQACCAREATLGIVGALARAAEGGRMRECDTLTPVLSQREQVPPLPLGEDRGEGVAPLAGFITYPGSTDGAFAIGLPFGRTNAATLERLADLADRFSESTLRTCPWRAILLGRVRAADAPALCAAVVELGLIADPYDQRPRITA